MQYHNIINCIKKRYIVKNMKHSYLDMYIYVVHNNL